MMRQDVALTALFLDTENPRLEIQQNHRDSVRELFRTEPKKMMRLVEDIEQHGMLNPLEKIGVSPSEEHEGRYVVHEGNRRVAALLALHTPDLLAGTINEMGQKHVRDLSAKYLKARPVEQVECEVLPLDELKHWIALRHTGENQGAGIVPWGTVEKGRYLERIGARKPVEVQFLDRYLEHVGAGQEEVARVRKVPATNLRRILETASVRKKFGIKINDKGWAFSDYPAEEMFKWLRRVVHDLSSGKTKVRNIYTASKIGKYIDGFGETDVPDTKTALREPVPVQPVDRAQEPPVAPAERRKKPKRWSLREAKIHPKHPRLQDIMDELGGIAFEKANIHAVMLRVFLELSTDDFLHRHNVTLLPDKGKHVTLRARLLGAIDFAAKKGWLAAKEAGAARKIAGSTKLSSAGTLSDYVHNQNLHPSPVEVMTLWKNLTVYLVAVHDH